MSKIIWIDDEVDLLKPHIVFLENKGYAVTPVNNVNEALEMIEAEKFQACFHLKVRVEIFRFLSILELRLRYSLALRYSLCFLEKRYVV